MGFLAIFVLLLGWIIKLDRGSILEKGIEKQVENHDLRQSRRYEKQ